MAVRNLGLRWGDWGSSTLLVCAMGLVLSEIVEMIIELNPASDADDTRGD
jgi:hypothetical protein